MRTGRSRDEIVSVLPSFLTNFDAGEEWELTALHEAVLGLNPRLRVEDVIQVTANIDEADAEGRTALWWASWCSDWATVRMLLEHGADPNKADCAGLPPLFPV